MNIVIGKCYIRDIIIDNKDLVETHWDEVSYDERNTELWISNEGYFNLEREGYLSCTAVYDSSSMVGYAVFTITKSIHTGKLKADNDCIYISPRYRHFGIADDLLAQAELEAKKLGATSVGVTMKSYSRFDRLLISAGYELTEIRYSKLLGEK